MKVLSGNDCPIIFGRWKPDKLEVNYDYDPSRIQDFYYFGFITVRVYGGVKPVVSTENSFLGETYINPYSEEALFNPRIEEMYRDAKLHVSRKLGMPEKDIDSVSKFRSATKFMIDIDPGVVCQDDYGRCLINIGTGENAKNIYRGLEEELIKEFGTPQRDWNRRFFLLAGKFSDDKFMKFPNGVVFASDAVLDERYDEVPSYATKYVTMAVISEEGGNRKTHGSIYRKCLDFLKNEKNIVRSEPGNPVMSSIGENRWMIDLSGIKMDRKTRESVFLMH